MKKILVLLSTLLLGLSLCGFNYDESKQRVFDDADVLSPSEEVELEKLCKEYSLNDKCDYVIVTTKDLQGKSIMAYADDFFDYNGFGYNKEMGDGSVFVVDFSSREYWFSTSGKVIERINDGEVDNVNAQVEDKLRDAEYFKAFELYVKRTSEAFNGNFSNNPLSKWYISLGISAVIAAIVTLILALQQKSKVTVGSRSYSKNMHAKTGGNWDRFIRRTTTRSAKSSSSSGGGSSHRSSSGSRHGGGGGRF